MSPRRGSRLVVMNGRSPLVNYNDNSGGVFALIAIFGFLFFLIAVAAYVVSSFFYMKLFDKAGVEGKWRGWVPLYRELVFGKLGDLSPWPLLIAFGAAFLLYLIPYVGAFVGWIPGLASTIYLCLAAYRVGLKLQKEAAWVVLYFFLSIVWLGIAAFDRSRWNPAIAPAQWASNGFLADRTVWQGIPVQPSAAAPGYGSVPPPAAYPPPGYTPPPPAGYAPPPTTQPPSPDEPPRV